MQEYAEITGFRKTDKGTELLVLVPEKDCIVKLKKFAKGGKVPTLLRIDDNRNISIEQLRKSHVLMTEIATYLGYPMEWFKSLMKSWYVEVHNDLKDGFSMADMSIDQARRFINLIIEFAFDMNIALRFEEMPSIVEIDGFLYICLVKRKCACCGEDAELHHWDTVGSNGGRKHDDSYLRKISLCRVHHVEIHKIGRDSFKDKYHVYGLKFL